MKWYNRIAHLLGYELIRLKKQPTLQAHLARLLRHLNIATVLDVGANVGQYGLLLRELGYRGRICSFEPVAAHYQALLKTAEDDDNWLTFPFALGAKEEVLEINVTDDASMSSFHSPNQYAAERFPDSSVVLHRERVRISTLDEFFRIHGKRCGDGPIFLKMDTQGHDLEVVKGGAVSIARIAALQSELSLLPIYTGTPNYRYVLEYLNKLGFTPSGIYPVSRDYGNLALIEIDCVMVRKADSD